MGVLDHFPPAYASLFRNVDEAVRANLARLDAGEQPRAGEQAVFGMWAQLRLGLGYDGGHDYPADVLRTAKEVAESETPWTAQDVHLLWDVANGLMTWGHTNYRELYRIPLAAIRTLGYSERRDLLVWAVEWFRRYHRPVWEVLHEELEEVLTEPAEHGPAGIVRNLIWDCDPIAVALAEEFGERLADPAVLPLLRHWATARSSKVSARWLTTARALLTPQVGALVREILALVATHREGRADNSYGVTFLHQFTSVPVRGMVWTCELIDEPWITQVLGDLALTCGVGLGGTGANCRSEMLANAAVNVLARRGGLDTVPALARLQTKVRKKSVLANVARTLDAVAEQAGLSTEQLLDRTVPTFGLGPDGVREDKIGDFLVRLSVDGPGLQFFNAAGKPVKAAPQAVRKTPELAALKASLKELKQVLPAERFRLERALTDERRWRWDQVCEFFLDHPVTGAYARSLIWQIPQGASGLPVRTGGGWALTDPAGRVVRPSDDSPIQLWHPIRESADEVRGWRDHLLDGGVRQPYKQAFREVYLLTPAEELTGTYSGRFAGHVLRYGQAKALLNQRGWTGLAIGHWDYECGGDQGEAAKELSGFVARWGMYVVGDPDEDGWDTASYCASEQIRIFHDDVPVSLAEVPPLVLSEILRDADLAVGVASVGLDQEAIGGHEEYWHDFGFGELSESARTRRDALLRLVPRLKIADRLEVGERFLRVCGDLRTYRIHLGSGNILMEPDDAYLCIVPGPGHHDASVFLPFEEEGGMLSVILSKAFLLSDDRAITDPSITRQLTLR
ncbi:DUF4132 domain-containing protein [Nonomuraea endophytica]|uniref:DUF4132 domain-containing protein n=1 Tax=Nonomuraea endophytica TaxID=714136 RepID=A0A7W8AB65_9ACTN|nr:DUF4132 domain-containing protein [Nonomuraea endophytica]MBB5081995.1 hypothetical protein [Nonomuraea endophytica]